MTMDQRDSRRESAGVVRRVVSDRASALKLKPLLMKRALQSHFANWLDQYYSVYSPVWQVPMLEPRTVYH